MPNRFPPRGIPSRTLMPAEPMPARIKLLLASLVGLAIVAGAALVGLSLGGGA